MARRLQPAPPTPASRAGWLARTGPQRGRQPVPREETAAGIDEVRSRARKSKPAARAHAAHHGGRAARPSSCSRRPDPGRAGGQHRLPAAGRARAVRGPAFQRVSTAAVVPSASSASPSVTAPATARLPVGRSPDGERGAVLPRRRRPSARAASPRQTARTMRNLPHRAEVHERRRDRLAGPPGLLHAQARSATPRGPARAGAGFARLNDQGSGEEVARVLGARVREC